MIESNQNFIIAAYAVTWVVLLGYVVHLARRGARAHAAHERAAGDATGRLST